MLVTNEGETIYHPLQSVYLKIDLQNVGRDIGNYEVIKRGFNKNGQPVYLFWI